MSRHANVVVADPPWVFGDKLPGKGRGAEKHYKVMSLSDIMRHPLPPLEDDAMLCLWRVGSQPQEALDVVKAWGFVVKSEIVWIKTKPGASDDESEEALEDEKSKAMGMGHYVRNEHEVCLVCTRGKFKVADRGVRSTFRAPRLEHSEKPDKFYALVERLAGPDREGHLVELFGRKARPGWHVYGDEIPQGYVWTPRTDVGDPVSPNGGLAVAPATGQPGKAQVDARAQPPTSDAASPAVTSTPAARGSEEAVPARACKGPGGSHRFDTVASDGKRHCTDCNRHIFVGDDAEIEADLLGAPEFIDPPGDFPSSTRKDLLIRAHQEKILNLDELSGDIDEAWITLVKRAPVGWFKIARNQPPEPEGAIGTLHGMLNGRYVKVTLPEVAAWSTFQRDVARLWVEQGGDKPPFFPSSCAACDRGEPLENAYKHTGDGTYCRPSAITPGFKSKSKPAASQAAPEPQPSLPPPPAEAAASSGVASAAVAPKTPAVERTVPLFSFD